MTRMPTLPWSCNDPESRRPAAAPSIAHVDIVSPPVSKGVPYCSAIPSATTSQLNRKRGRKPRGSAHFTGGRLFLQVGSESTSSAEESVRSTENHSSGCGSRDAAGGLTRLSRNPDTAMPLMRGIGPTLIPRPQRMYLRFGEPIDTTKPENVATENWVESVRNSIQQSLEVIRDDLLAVRSDDPFRELNRFAWSNAVKVS
jgi:hypothetical protein